VIAAGSSGPALPLPAGAPADRGRKVASLAQRRWVKPALLCAPAIVFLLAVYLVPLGMMMWSSVAEPKLGFGNYLAFFASGHNLKVLGNTFLTAATVTLCSILIAYPIAYVAALDKGWFGPTLIAVVALSFWTNFLVRTYAWMVIFSTNGPATTVLEWLGWQPAPKLLFTTFAATIAMTQMLVPFMIFAMYAVMRRIDPAYMRAAASLGARPLHAFLTVYLPLSVPGIVNGVTLVFITCLGFYVTPILLGSPQDKMMSGAISDQVELFVNFGGASAMSMVLLVLTLVLYSIYNRYVGIEKLWR
jgi:putative spermidine/putrescine transport system permease protein